MEQEEHNDSAMKTYIHFYDLQNVIYFPMDGQLNF